MTTDWKYSGNLIYFHLGLTFAERQGTCILQNWSCKILRVFLRILEIFSQFLTGIEIILFLESRDRDIGCSPGCSQTTIIP